MRRGEKTASNATASASGPTRGRRFGSTACPRVAILTALVAVGLALWEGTAQGASPRCTLAKIAELPARLLHYKVIVEGAVNGRAVNVMLDTGATATIIPRPAADRLGLARQRARGRMIGIGGETDVESAFVDEFRLGDAAVKGRRMMVAGDREPGDDVGVILGEDFFRGIDVEFDLAHNVVRLFRPDGCFGVSMAYWAPGGASEVPIEQVSDVRPAIVLTVQVNGQPVRALLDSGAWTSLLDAPEAARLSIVAEGADAPAGRSQGLGPGRLDWWVGSVRSIVIGDESIKDTKIRVAELSRAMRYTSGTLVRKSFEEATDMLLGIDFLRSHRVLVAHSQQKMYFTYVGGRVFDWSAPAGERTDSDRAIADDDAAVRSNPQDPEAYFRRANAWYERKEYDKAIADYDASIRIHPDRASAWSNRARARIAKGDYGEAIADATRAIEIDPTVALAYVNRGDAKRRSGDPEGAIDDYARAIEVDPRLAIAFNQMAWLLATAERPASRDGRRAVESALKACELTQWKNLVYIDTLAAAYARAGNFEEAVKWQRKVIEGSSRARDESASLRLRSYEQGKAWPAE